MPAYRMTWITDRLAAGWAPMSVEDIEAVKSAGITGIVNLCGEYPDIADIEKQFGFEVLYLPLEDGGVPGDRELDEALAWLDEAVYLGKKVLVHCLHGVGRTGTFITSYLLRRGFGLSLAGRTLKSIRSMPSSFRQWRHLGKYNRKNKKLGIRKPTLQFGTLVDLTPYFAEYESFINEIENKISETIPSDAHRCGRETTACCSRSFSLQLIEAAYLSNRLNARLTREERMSSTERASSAGQFSGGQSKSDKELIPGPVCPLLVRGACIAYPYRPVVCRLSDLPQDKQNSPHDLSAFSGDVPETLHTMSGSLFFALNSARLPDESLRFPIHTVVSGKFVEHYFRYLTGIVSPPMGNR